MTASGMVSAGRTKLPTFALAVPIRPENGARMMVKLFWTFRLSSAD
jgi:hypothetical protein